MKIEKKLIIALCLLLSVGSTKAQVTIGSSTAPAAGALLQLKDTEVTDGSANAKKGLKMPRVTLTDRDKLKPMYSYADPANTPSQTDEQAHVGLLVYHTEECELDGKGLYVWIGSKWQILGDKTYTPTLTKTYFDLPSGHDARSITPESLIVTHNSGTPKWNLMPTSLPKEIEFAQPNSKSGNVGASPYTMTLLPKPMTDAEIKANPWVSKENKLEFTNLATECGLQDYVTINQTNYAMKANGAFDNSQIIYTAKTATTGTFDIQSNAKWTTTLEDPYNSLISTIPIIGTKHGQELKDGTTPPAQSFTYTVNGAGAKYHLANITFKDTATVKRFDDVNISFVNCKEGSDPSLEEWAQRAGFTLAEIAEVLNGTAPNDGGVSSIVKNGYQLHRDQGDDGYGNNGKLFISSAFGVDPDTKKEQRWMVVNLAARSYALGTRTGTDATAARKLPTVPDGKIQISIPSWNYPNYTGANTYDKSPRMGLVYNWAAAYNLAYGEVPILTTESKTPPHDITPKRQGICPNGWHFPSDWEWTQLEMEINQNTSKYANMEDINSTIEIGALQFRGYHSPAMKDSCPVVTSVPRGYSNPIDSRHAAGFSVMMVGSISPDGKGGGVEGYGTRAYFWSSSATSGSAWGRWFTYPSTYPGDPDPDKDLRVRRYDYARQIFGSVRCKKD